MSCPCKTTIDHPNEKGDLYDRTGRERGDDGLEVQGVTSCPDPRPAGLVEHHAFNGAIRDTFDEATDISDVRALEYGDTWGLDAMRDGFLGLTLALPQLPHLRREYIRLVRCAAIIDIKVSRLSGPWKPDTLTDLVNYQAAYLQWRAGYDLASAAPFEPRLQPGRD